MRYFITENFLKNYTGYNNNIDMSKVEYLIKMTYDIEICPLLGDYFANYLLDLHQAVINGTYTYTSLEDRLVELIQYTMSWNVNRESVIELSDQLTNKGSIQNNGDYQMPSPLVSMRYKLENYNSNYQAYVEKLSNFLCENKDSFPEFIDKLNTNSKILKSCTCCNNSALVDYGLFFV
jgi:hypothetical protein